MLNKTSVMKCFCQSDDIKRTIFILKNHIAGIVGQKQKYWNVTSYSFHWVAACCRRQKVRLPFMHKFVLMQCNSMQSNTVHKSFNMRWGLCDLGCRILSLLLNMHYINHLTTITVELGFLGDLVLLLKTCSLYHEKLFIQKVNDISSQVVNIFFSDSDFMEAVRGPFQLL